VGRKILLFQALHPIAAFQRFETAPVQFEKCLDTGIRWLDAIAMWRQFSTAFPKIQIASRSLQAASFMPHFAFLTYRAAPAINAERIHFQAANK